jgi:5-methylcytosine-specific restriction endonuclease McrA
MPSGVYIRTAEHNKARSLFLTGTKKSEAWKLKHSGLNNSSWKGGIHIHEYICECCKCLFTKEGYAKKYNYKYCSASCASKDYIRTNEWCEKISASLKARYRKEGLKQSSYHKFTGKLKLKIRTRDGFKCKECGISELELGRKLDVHHIDYNKENYHKSNLISLCNSCHTKTNFNRKQWKKYYADKI